MIEGHLQPESEASVPAEQATGEGCCRMAVFSLEAGFSK
jgi:hypothetical protein